MNWSDWPLFHRVMCVVIGVITLGGLIYVFTRPWGGKK